MAKQLTKKISFPQYDEDLFEYLENQNNASALVRQLLRAHKNGEILMANSNPVVSQQETKPINNAKEEIKDSVDSQEVNKEDKKLNKKREKTDFSAIFEKAKPINSESLLALNQLEGI